MLRSVFPLVLAALLGAAPSARAARAASLAPGQMRAHLIDVGQGAATLFEFSCGAVLVDTGGESNAAFRSDAALRAYLDAFFERRSDLARTLELVVLTHPHKDHTDNAALVASEYTVRNVATNGQYTGSGVRQQNRLRERMAAGHLETVTAAGIRRGGRTSSVIDPVRCRDVDPKLSVLWGSLARRPAGWTLRDFRSENNHSVALRVDFGRASFLVTGDLEEKGIEALLAKHAGTSALDVDVWQVSHHGSHNGVTLPMTAALTPVIALLATGAEERHIAPFSAWAHGHPRESVIDLLGEAVSRTRPVVTVKVASGQRRFHERQIHKAIYATGWEGSVVVTADKEARYRVETER